MGQLTEEAAYARERLREECMGEPYLIGREVDALLDTLYDEGFNAGWDACTRAHKALAEEDREE